jgi:hypothetical protein
VAPETETSSTHLQEPVNEFNWTTLIGLLIEERDVMFARKAVRKSKNAPPVRRRATAADKRAAVSTAWNTKRRTE